MKKFISVLIIIMLILMSIQNTLSVFATSDSDTVNIYVDLTSLKTTVNETTEEIKAYTQDEFDTFVSDFNSNNLPEIYITEFLYDGAGMVKTPDLDDFIEEDSNDAKIKTLKR